MAAKKGKTSSSYDEELNLERLEQINEIRAKPKGYFETDILWADALFMLLIHSVFVIILFTFPYQQKWRTVLFLLAHAAMSLTGVMVFAHRYLSHRSFKATAPLKILMVILYASSGQYSPYSWVKDHRVHHKYCDTLADPYNAKRGFFFSHFGWIVMKRTPQYFQRAKFIDMKDFKNDPLLVLVERQYHWFFLIFAFIVPTFACCFLWKETFFHSMLFNFVRFVIILNCIASINSVSHAFGDKPFDKNSTASESLLVTILSCGEGWHNYHHKFPWDYKAGEPGKLNFAAAFIKFFSKLGWAYDLKQASPALVKKVMENNSKRT